MKMASDLAPIDLNAARSPLQAKSDAQEPVATFGALSSDRKGVLINYIVDALDAAHPFQFKRLTTDKPTWVSAFKRALLVHPDLQMMDNAQIKVGVKAAKAREFMPTNAEQFVRLCDRTPADYGLPSAMDAYIEAASKSHDPIGQTWSHDAVRMAGNGMWFNLRSSGSQFEHESIRRAYIARYNQLAERVVRGEMISGDDTQLLEDRRGKVEYADVAGELYLRERMVSSGIDPDGGRAEFLRIMGGL